MLGRLLWIAVGAAAGVIGKTVYDETKSSSSSDSVKEEPPKLKAYAPLDPKEEIGKCKSEIGRLESELEAVKNSAWDLDAFAGFLASELGAIKNSAGDLWVALRKAVVATKEAQLAAVKKRLAELNESA